MYTILKVTLFLSLIVLAGGCAHQNAKQDNFMKNTPQQMKIDKLPFTEQIGIIYEV